MLDGGAEDVRPLEWTAHAGSAARTGEAVLVGKGLENGLT